MSPSTGRDISDTNIASLGTKLERDIKQASASSEEAWQLVKRDTPGLWIWRIEQFNVVPITKKDYGTFYSGDSYIILKAYKPNANSERVAYNVHFWLGAGTSHDEAGTAAYKTVELDNYLNDAAVQYREIQGHETALFTEYFATMHVLDGGIKSGFHSITTEPPKPRLLHVKGKGNSVCVNQVPCHSDSLNHGDIFILDAGDFLIQWNGSISNPFEKSKAAHVASAICKQRNCKLMIYDDGQSVDETKSLFFSILEGGTTIKNAIPDQVRAPEPLVLYNLSDRSGSLQFTLVKTGNVSNSDFKSDDTYILDCGFQIFVWVGNSASSSEDSHGIVCAEKFLELHNRSKLAQIIRLIEGADCPLLDQVIRCQA